MLLMEVTEFGIVMPVNPVQSANASLPMDVTEAGIVMPVNRVQALNAPSPIPVTPDGIEYSAAVLPAGYATSVAL